MKIEEIILTFDQGNSFAKLAVFSCREGESPCLVTTKRFEKSPSVEEVAEMIESYHINGGIYCTVGHIDVRFIETLRGLLSGRLIILTHATPLPLQIEYSTPATLGLDRVAAAVGAMQICSADNVVVIDAGTAITEDLVCRNDKGAVLFRGGRISPGVEMRFKALNSFTSCLPLVKAQGSTPVLGESTEESIRAGVVRGVVAEIEGALKDYSGISQSGTTEMVITGGDSALIAQHLQGQVIVEPYLNELGLCSVYLHNQTAKFA